MLEIRQVVLAKPASCSECGCDIAVDALAYAMGDRERFGCLSCFGPSAENSESAGINKLRAGTPGGSAQREYERRRGHDLSAARNKRAIRLAIVAGAGVGVFVLVQIIGAVVNHASLPHTLGPAHPVFPAGEVRSIGVLLGLVAAVNVARGAFGRRQSTEAWATGARGERVVATRLDPLASRGVITLHDRRIPGSRANIDHIAVAPSGIFVIDAKVRKGKVEARRTGPIWDRGEKKIYVGGREHSSILTGMLPQVAAVHRALEDVPEGLGLPVHPMVTLIGAEWGTFARPITLRGVWIGWPKAMAHLIGADGPLGPEQVSRIATALAASLPEA